MKKYSKKIALILVLALVLATAIPALAATEFKTTIEGAYEDIDLQVLVPTTIQAVLNPYGLPVKIDADDGTPLDSLTSPGQIATKPLVGANLTDVNLKVGATVTGTQKGQFKLVTSAPSKTAKTNTGLVYLEMKSASNLGYVVDPDTNSATLSNYFDGASVMTEMNKWTLPTKYNSKQHLILSNGKATTKSGMCTITAGTASVEGGEIDTVSENGYFMARLTGSIVQKPTNPWVANDGFTAAITWEFEPAT